MSEKLIRTTCNSHCGGACPMVLHVEDGVITRIESEGEIKSCLRGRAYRQRVYAPDRLKHPLRRVGDRGKGEFERITWDAALDIVASELTRVRETYGPSAVLYFYSSGDIVWLNGPGLMENLLARTGGYSGTWGCASCEGAAFASRMSYGTRAGSNSRDDLANSRLILLWGWDPAVSISYGTTSLSLIKSKEAGARIIAIDPRYTDSAAAFAQQWIPIRPGTDAAMLVAMAHVMIRGGLHDQAYLDRHTSGFDRFRQYVMGEEDGTPKTPAWAEVITGVPAGTITSLAVEFATLKPAALMDGYAPGRTACGEQFHRAAIALAAMTGNIGIHGGQAPGEGTLGSWGAPLAIGPRVYERLNGGDNPVDREAPHRKDAFWYRKLGKPVYYYGGPSSSRVNRHDVADAISKGRAGGYPADYKLLYIVNCNYVNQYANTNKIIRALQNLEFIVVQEQFMTATARYADIVLPTNTFMERDDLTLGGIGMYYGSMSRAIDAQGEARSQFQIAAALAAKLGVPDFSAKTEEEWLKEVIGEIRDAPDYDEFRRRGGSKAALTQPFVCFEKQINDPANNPFPTPSGKIELYSQEIADLGDPVLPPVPKYVPAWEGRDDPLFRKYPLQLVTTHARRRALAQFDNIPWLRELYPQTIAISGLDARARGIAHGNMVRVYNERGEMAIRAEVTERIMPGVVDIQQGAWYSPDENGVDTGGCANVLTRDGRASPAGAFPSNTTLVQVEKLARR
ncbi:MAG: molybdopterin-dependent oxidoreductase [Chloroflexi bacterium]|nr:molybdopterin-dependent oxidoreductase [Chloroflexota bacterium]